MTPRVTPLLALVLAGCLASQLDTMKDRQAAGDLPALAATPVDCSGPDPVCAQAQTLRAEACLRLGQHACAEAGYAAALAALPTTAPASQRRVVLAGLAAAAMARRDAGQASPDAQLAAGMALLALDPSDPIGCTHARSARLALALLGPAGPARCAELAAAPACAANPALDRQIAAQSAACRSIAP
ncbi:hypothetical protein ACQW02_00755 [Humitalea sp. 24SJ18S-53]|uniref:hypothetical protein n=1 Tax=Humitalea sp. 24SJ18S-53 TaxID=3422307 RepID=UPI003D66F804